MLSFTKFYLSFKYFYDSESTKKHKQNIFINTFLFINICKDKKKLRMMFIQKVFFSQKNELPPTFVCQEKSLK